MVVELLEEASYYELYDEEVDARLEREARLTQERVQSELPFTRPRS